ncbi:MAG: Ig-like domain-containing protein, partial [Planctomycetota bacterium]|nr:Ig-like domain-containing protein [Planctomycetota bacterium]
FPSSAARKASTNNISGGTFYALLFEDSGYTLTGNALSIGSAGLNMTATSGTNTVSLAVTMTSTSTWSVAAGGTLTVDGTINNGGFELQAASLGTLALTGVISGAGGVTNSGIGTLQLSGNNTYEGVTMVNAGTLVASHAHALGAWTGAGGSGASAATQVEVGAVLQLSGGITIGNALNLFGTLENLSGSNTWSGPVVPVGTVQVDGSTSLAITGQLADSFSAGSGLQAAVQSGTTGVTKTGTGTLTLSGVDANTYTGFTRVTDGTLKLGKASALGSTAGATTVSGSGVLDLYGQTIGDESVDLSGNGSGTGALINSSTLASLSGAVTSTGGSYTVGGTGDITLSGAVTGALTKVGVNSLTLSGSADNVDLAVTATVGTVVLAKLISGPSVHAVGDLLIKGATVQLAGTGGDQICDDDFDDELVITSGVLDLHGTSEHILSLDGTGGTILNDASNTTSTLTVTQGGTFRGVITDGASGNGLVALTMDDHTATLTLTGTNTYTGPTTVIGGTLLINGSITSNVTVTNPGIFGGNGTITGDVLGTGTFSPGASAGQQTITGNFTPTGTVIFDVNSPYTTAGTNYDQYIVNGNVNLSGATLAFTQATAGTPASDLLPMTLISKTDGKTTTAGTSPADNSTVNLGSSYFKLLYNAGTGATGVLLDVNNAPVLTEAVAHAFTTITEDPTSNNGDAVSVLISGKITDADSPAPTLKGIAVTGLSSSTGTWQYSLDAGSSWTDVGAAANDAALLLRDIDKLRLVPDGQNATTASVTFRAWDQSGSTEGQQGNQVDATSNGGITPFSATTATADITVTALNDAPTLGSGTLAPVIENATNPPGATLATLFAGQFSDVDLGSSLAGIAVVGNTASAGSQGAWQYSSDSGAHWFAIGDVTDGATALALGTTTKIRFVPKSGFLGTPTALTVRGLDNTYSTNGGQFSTTSGGTESRAVVSTSSNGGVTAVAAVTASLQTTVTATTITANPTTLKKSETAEVTFSFAQATNLTIGNITPVHGTITNFAGSGTRYTATFTPTDDFEGTGTVSVNATTLQIPIDTLAPALDSITATDASPTKADSLAFTATFSEAVLGLTASNFALVANPAFSTSPSIGTPTSADGGLTWSVTVSGGTLNLYNGTLGLDLANAANVTDSAWNALATTTLEGETYAVDNIVPLAPVLGGIDPDTGTSNTDEITNATSLFFWGTAEANSTLAAWYWDAVGATFVFMGTTMTNDSGNWSAWAPLPQGSHQLKVTATDAAGNTGDYSSLFTIVVDTTVPTSTVTTAGLFNTAGWVAASSQIAGTASDSGSAGLDKVELSIQESGSNNYWNGSGWVSGETFVLATGTGTWIYAFAPSNAYSYTVHSRATDLAGNVQSSLGSSSFSYDSSPPSTTSFALHTPATSPTNANSLVFRATFSEAVTEVGIGDFAVNGSTTATVTGVTQVTTSTYDVTVSGGNLATFNGAVGLNFVASPSITDLAGNALPNTEPVSDQTYAVDHTPPTVTDAKISISGETAGTFKLGNTVTATWNSATEVGGNTDIATVTVDFSQFGGGTAVTATYSSVWTATYTILAGSIDLTSRNVSLTATDTAGNATTTADSTNVTVDNIAPTVTDAKISISGATGTGGTFKIDDTVTATWNNTAGTG